MLIGQQSIQLDEKNRIRVPAKFRDHLGDDFFLVCGPGKFLYVMPEREFLARVSLLNDIQMSNFEDIEAAMRVFSTAEKAEEDKQGRFVIPAALRAYADIDKKVKFLAAGKFLTIWADNENGIGTVEDMRTSYAKLGKYKI